MFISALDIDLVQQHHLSLQNVVPRDGAGQALDHKSALSDVGDNFHHFAPFYLFSVGTHVFAKQLLPVKEQGFGSVAACLYLDMLPKTQFQREFLIHQKGVFLTGEEILCYLHHQNFLPL